MLSGIGLSKTKYKYSPSPILLNPISEGSLLSTEMQLAFSSFSLILLNVSSVQFSFRKIKVNDLVFGAYFEVSKDDFISSL